MSAQPINIEIFGRSLRVICPLEQQEALIQAAQDLEKRLETLKNRTRVNNIEQLLFIAALNACNELSQEKDKTRDYATNVEHRVTTLQKTLEQVLIEQSTLAGQSSD